MKLPPSEWNSLFIPAFIKKLFPHKLMGKVESFKCSRRTFNYFAALAVSSLLAPRVSYSELLPSNKESENPDNYKKAVNSYNSMMRNFAMPGGLFRATYPFNIGIPSPNWDFSQAMAAVIEMNRLTSNVNHQHLQMVKKGLEKYWDSKPAKGLPAYNSTVKYPLIGDPEKYLDDGAWDGLNLVRLFEYTGYKDAFLRGQEVFEFACANFDQDSECMPGGIPWVQQTESQKNHDRNTVSNAPNAQLGLRLFQLTGIKKYFGEAKKMYDWVNKHMHHPEEPWLYRDHVDGECATEDTIWTYNQGCMSGAGALLYKITEDRQYLDQSETTAQAALDYFGEKELLSQPAQFNQIFFRNLLFLSSVTRSQELKNQIKNTVETYADNVWKNTNIRKKGDIFYFQGGNALLLDQAAMVQIYSMLAQDSTNYHTLI